MSRLFSAVDEFILMVRAENKLQQIARVEFGAEPECASCVTGMMAGMRSWIVPTSSLAGTVLMQNVRSHLAILIAPVLPDAGDAERRAVGHGEGVQLLAFVALVENIHRHDAAALCVSVGEHALLGDGLGAGGRGSELVIGPRFARSRWCLCAPYAC